MKKHNKLLSSLSVGLFTPTTLLAPTLVSCKADSSKIKITFKLFDPNSGSLSFSSKKIKKNTTWDEVEKPSITLNDGFGSLGWVTESGQQLTSSYILNKQQTFYFYALPEEDQDSFTITTQSGDTEATITKYNGADTVVVIPAYVQSGDTTIPVTNISGEAFRETNIELINIPETVTTIGEKAFLGCDSLETVILHDGLETIGSLAFNECPSISSITIPKTVSSLGDCNPFCCAETLDTSELKSLVVDKQNPTFHSQKDGVEYNCIWDNDGNLIAGCSTTQIPEEGITNIGEYAFAGCQLESIIIPNTVITMQDGVFQNCLCLKSVDLSNQLKSMGIQTFTWCLALEDIELPDSLEEMGPGAVFSQCTNLTRINIPANLKSGSIRGDTFYLCDSLETITVDPSNASYSSQNQQGDECNCLYSKGSDHTLFRGCSNTVVPESVTKFAFGAFSGLGMTTFAMPANVTTLADYVFHYCSKLTTIDLSNYDVGIDLSTLAWEEDSFTTKGQTGTVILPSGTDDTKKGQWTTKLQSAGLDGWSIVVKQ